jgi:hypothetical protein
MASVAISALEFGALRSRYGLATGRNDDLAATHPPATGRESRADARFGRVHRRGKLFPNSTDEDERFLDSSRNLTIATPFRLLARLRV